MYIWGIKNHGLGKITIHNGDFKKGLSLLEQSVEVYPLALAYRNLAVYWNSEGDLDKAFTQIDEDLRSQYVLAYTPTNGVKDGSFRTIQLRVKNQKDLNVRHRRGYFAPGAKAS